MVGFATVAKKEQMNFMFQICERAQRRPSIVEGCKKARATRASRSGRSPGFAGALFGGSAGSGNNPQAELAGRPCAAGLPNWPRNQ